MNTKQALEKVGYCNDLPIVETCQRCNLPLNEQSKVIMESREDIEYLVSSGWCPKCYNEEIEKIRQSKLLNNL